ncbi:MAG: cytochrome [Rhodospirillales bacterium]|nr:cytochrome [Rhodospirillales bacterium]
MSSHYPPHSAACALLALVLAGWAGVAAAQTGNEAEMQSTSMSVAVTTLFPGGGMGPPPDPTGAHYDGNPKAIANGARLFDWYNCSGCHFHGAGGIGPALMDDTWIYGGAIDQIFASIYQGRPNGMPSWARKIPDAQIWEIAAYVRSLSTPSAANGPGQPVPKPPPQPSGVPAPPTPATSGSDANK